MGLIFEMIFEGIISATVQIKMVPMFIKIISLKDSSTGTWDM